MNNNILIGSFLIFFLAVGFLSPLIGDAFDEQSNTYDISAVNTNNDIGDANSIMEIISGIFVWVINAPVWLNIFIWIIRIIFLVIVYDKFRGVSS
jgi:hypothetical protein